jgi:hypothetical protein
MDAASMAAGLKQSGRNYSPWIAVFNMCNAAIGSGVLSFPYAFRQTGVFGGLFYTGIIWLVEVGALLLLIRTAEKYKTKSYQVSLAFPSSPWLMELRKCDTFAGIISMEFCELKE